MGHRNKIKSQKNNVFVCNLAVANLQSEMQFLRLIDQLSMPFHNQNTVSETFKSALNKICNKNTVLESYRSVFNADLQSKLQFLIRRGLLTTGCHQTFWSADNRLSLAKCLVTTGCHQQKVCWQPAVYFPIAMWICMYIEIFIHKIPLYMLWNGILQWFCYLCILLLLLTILSEGCKVLI